MARGVLFVDVLDCENGVVGVEGAGLFDAGVVQSMSESPEAQFRSGYSPGIRALADCLGDDAKRHVTRQRGQLRMLHLWLCGKGNE